jgi:hypothetical protein
MAKVKKSKAELQAELSKANEATITSVDASAPETVEAPVAPVAEVAKPKAPGKIAQILAFFKSGMSTKDIAKQFVLDGEGNKIATEEKDAEGNVVFETFHPTTISIQVNKYKKANPDIYPPQAPAPTKAEKAAAKKAEKEAQEKEVASAEAAVDTQA